MLNQPWSIRLLGALSASQTGIHIDRFRSQKTGILLAYLAFWPKRSHTRSALIELYWPESELEAGQQSLRVALFSLRRQLEPPGVPTGAVIRADRRYAGLNPEAFTTDVAEFQSALALAEETEDKAEAIAHIRRAVGVYQGELLPGNYDDWVLTERSHLTDAYLGALGRLVRNHADAGNWEGAAEMAWRAVQADPLREASYRTLIRIYLVLKRSREVHALYELLAQRLRESLGVSPSRATRELAETISLEGTFVGATEPAPHINKTSLVTRANTNFSPALHPVQEPLVGTPRYRVPPRLTRFFGREEQIAHLTRLLLPTPSLLPVFDNAADRGEAAGEAPTFSESMDEAGRLVTLTGPGGTGKTCLAMEVGARLEERFPGGVAFVSLAHLVDSRLLAREIREALGAPSADPEHPLDAVITVLGRWATLLILDNLEQIAESAALVVRDLLLRLPSLIILVTSRRSLGLKGEREFAVSSLHLPDVTDSSEEMLRSASVQLFVDRARAVQPDFQIHDRNRAEVAALCMHLDGMPLAIELAAARARVLAPAQMLAHLTDRFQLLVNRHAGKDSRHRSLRSAIEWSLRLLFPDVRRFFLRLSVFQGGWTLEAAEAVCLERAESGDALDFLEQLRIDSMIQTESQGSLVRFRMLESLREFGYAQLSSLERGEIAQRHAVYFEAYAERIFERLRSPEPSSAHEALDRENDNLRAALNYLLSGDGDHRIQGLRLATRLSAWWYTRAAFREGSDWMDRALATAPASTPARHRALALHSAGRLAGGRGEIATARDFFEASLVISRQIEDTLLIAEASTGLAVALQMLNEQEESHRLLQECLTIYRVHGDRWHTALTLLNLGSSRWQIGELDSARTYYQESLQLSGELEAKHLCSQNILSLSVVEQLAGNPALARAYAEEGLSLAEAMQSPLGIAYGLFSLGTLESKERRFDRSTIFLCRSLRILGELGERRILFLVLAAMAELAAAMGQYRRAVRLLAATRTLHKRLHSEFKPSSYSEKEVHSVLKAARASLPPADFEHAWAQGVRHTLDLTLEYALSDAE